MLLGDRIEKKNKILDKDVILFGTKVKKKKDLGCYIHVVRSVCLRRVQIELDDNCLGGLESAIIHPTPLQYIIVVKHSVSGNMIKCRWKKGLLQ
jgi:hypothetical protein